MSTDSSLSILCLFIDADSSGEVHQKAINRYVIPEKYVSEQLLAYKDTHQEYGGGQGGSQNCQPPNTASTESTRLFTPGSLSQQYLKHQLSWCGEKAHKDGKSSSHQKYGGTIWQMSLKSIVPWLRKILWASKPRQAIGVLLVLSSFY